MTNQPDYHIGAEESLLDQDQTNRIGALWEQDSDQAPYQGYVMLMGQKIPIVLFENDGGDQ